ncbi:hypothetical protein R75461_07765 [Paraburkholderia nemoris]|uniref:hypothetical protein n=1 Tax=Paraburkholderia nemoris TaxID=2793076 RepID=UPI00190B29C8|nr:MULTISPECIES: hypothetical protein [Paraburkholderia]MBK3786536.1 hypothetical protein [Paraburkholderia aspalathi]CAE6856979.1 hypothetical protein R75461_07765 [Paraburkholderia nemoris]
MKKLVIMALAAASAAGLIGCVQPQTYGRAPAVAWTRDAIEQAFPEGTPRKQVFARLGNPSGEHSANGLIEWDYGNGRSSLHSVTFIFSDETLVEKRFSD